MQPTNGTLLSFNGEYGRAQAILARDAHQPNTRSEPVDSE
jgi:hypothetical protein